MNIVFWTVWIALSYLPQYLMQKFIDNYGEV
jgi:hypothetical protein